MSNKTVKYLNINELSQKLVLARLNLVKVIQCRTMVTSVLVEGAQCWREDDVDAWIQANSGK